MLFYLLWTSNFDKINLMIIIGVMVAWTGIEHFLLGRFDPPPPADEPEDAMVCPMILFNYEEHA